jgi:hypothetical protein
LRDEINAYIQAKLTNTLRESLHLRMSNTNTQTFLLSSKHYNFIFMKCLLLSFCINREGFWAPGLLSSLVLLEHSTFVKIHEILAQSQAFWTPSNYLLLWKNFPPLKPLLLLRLILNTLLY